MNRVEGKLFEGAARWADDREAARARSRQRAWLLVWVLAAVAVVEGFALIALAPLKTVVPYTILVDRQTGYVTTLDPARPAVLGADQALIRSMLVQYVVAREGFSLPQVRQDYRRVMSWSSGTARASYARDMAATNPDSPLARYGRSAVVEVVPKTVSELSDRSAMVRFDVVHSDGAGRSLPPVPHAAVINYRIQPREMTVEERFLNPLGFEVTRYRRDPEAAPTPGSAQSMPPPAATSQAVPSANASGPVP